MIFHYIVGFQRLRQFFFRTFLLWTVPVGDSINFQEDFLVGDRVLIKAAKEEPKAWWMNATDERQHRKRLKVCGYPGMICVRIIGK